MDRLFRARAGLVLAVLLPALVQAEQEAPVVTHAEVVVPLPRAEAADDATASATVVETDRFAGESKNVAELVATAPGVAVNHYGGLGQLATVSIRGSTADEVQVLLDGLPLNTAAGGGVDLSRIPRAWIERIEVVRGAEGAIYGSGAVGGVVNIVTRPAVAGTWSAEATAGSFRTFGASVDGATGGPRWGLLGAATVDDTSGRFTYLFDPRPTLSGSALEVRQRDHNAAFTAGALAKLWAGIGRGRLDAVLHVTGGARDLPGSPYAETPRDAQHDGRIGLVAKMSQPLGDGILLTVGGAARADELTILVEPSPETRQRDLAGELSGRVLWVAGPSALTLHVGAGAERLEASPTSGAPGAVAHSRGTFTVAAADELDVAGGRLRVVPALRWDRSGQFDGWSAKLGASLRLGGPLSIRANAGRSYRLPSFAELYLQQGLLAPNPGLTSEEGWSGDTSLVAEGALGLASVGAFATLYRDLIVYEAASFRRMKPFNDGKALATGLEAELATVPLTRARLTFSAAYTLLATETLRGSDATLGRDLPHRPRHRLFARVASDLGVVGAHVEAHYVSGQFLDLENLLPVPATLLFNCGGSVRLLRHPDLRAHLEVRNLLDDRSLQDGFGNPLPGRMFLVTLRMTGGKDSATQ